MKIQLNRERYCSQKYDKENIKRIAQKDENDPMDLFNCN